MAPFKGGLLMPEPAQLAALATSATVRIILNGTWPAGVPSDYSASNGAVASVP